MLFLATRSDAGEPWLPKQFEVYITPSLSYAIVGTQPFDIVEETDQILTLTRTTDTATCLLRKGEPDWSFSLNHPQEGSAVGVMVPISG